MKFKMYGTRGSMAVSSPEKVIRGGNTTCMEIVSECLPPDMVFAADGGTGLFQLSQDTIGERHHLVVVKTHYHWDHLDGWKMTPHALQERGKVHIFGPLENGYGPERVMRYIFKKPFFPVEFELMKERFKCRTLDNPGNQVLVIHPEAGVHLIRMSKYQHALSNGRQLHLGSQHHSVKECLVVKMQKTDHPDFAVSFRFEEHPTGRVGTFMTDHEKQASHPADLVEHVRGSHVLVQDAQHSEEAYPKKAGHGHGTPRYCVELAIRAEVEKLYLTHHDPLALDSDIDAQVEDARRFAKSAIESKYLKFIGAASDYEEIEV